MTLPLRAFRNTFVNLTPRASSSRASLQSQLHKRHFSTRFRYLEQRAPSKNTSRPKRQPSPLRIWPFVAILLGGSYIFYGLVQSRSGVAPMPAIESERIPAPKRNKQLYSPDEATVIFVLGGPGAGKGTQCANLVKDYGFKHLSAGDLLREEQNRPGSEFGELIKSYIREGKIVPMEVTIQLLENAMRSAIEHESNRKFLIDGFPRQMDQALAFEESVVPSSFTLFFDCPEEVMEQRLLDRGKTSGRSDDNIESIKKRFKTFVETSMPVVDHFEKEGRVVKVQATRPAAEVYAVVKQRLADRGIKPSD